MAGVQNVVAPQGTAFTADHARILKRYVEEVVLCFDSDEAGQKAAVRSLDHLLASGLAVRVATMPPPHDPDSFIKDNGGLAFKQLIDGAEGFFDYYLNQLCAANQVGSDKGRLAILREMGVAVHKTANVVLIDKYAQKTALRLGVSPEAVRIEFRKLSRQTVRSPEPTSAAPPETSAEQRPTLHESWLLRLLFRHDELVPWAAAHLELNWIQHPLAKEIVSRRLAAHRNGTWASLATFLEECDSEAARSLVTEAASEERNIPNPSQQIADVVLRLRNQSIDRELAALIQRAGQPGLDDSERLDLLKCQQELRSNKRRPLES